MPRPEKTAAVDDVHERLTSSAATLLTDYRGLSVSELADLRAELRKANASYRVVKNTLTALAAEQAGMEGLTEYLVGPTALVFCHEDPVGPAKALRTFGKDHPDLIVKAGYLDGEVLDAEATSKLADLESREELIASLAGLLYGALANVARLLQAPLEHQARLVQALADAGGYEGGPAPAEESAAEAEEEPASEAEEEPAADVGEEPAAEAEADEPAAAVEAQAEGVADRVEEAVTGAASAVADAVVSGVETVTETVGDAADRATETVTGAATGAADAVEEAAETVTDADVAEGDEPADQQDDDQT